MKSLKQCIGNYIENCTGNYLNESLFDDEDAFLDPERDKGIIESWIKENYSFIGRLKINKDLTVDHSGSISVKNQNITSLTNGMFRWGVINRYFECFGCKNLKSLEGAPKKVGGGFDCSHCDNLLSLEGAPEKIDGGFYCYGCENLLSLKGAPKEVGGDFYCYECENLLSLEGASKEVKGDFSCSGCDKLISLEGSPENVGCIFIVLYV